MPLIVLINAVIQMPNESLTIICKFSLSNRAEIYKPEKKKKKRQHAKNRMNYCQIERTFFWSIDMH